LERSPAATVGGGLATAKATTPVGLTLITMGWKARWTTSCSPSIRMSSALLTLGQVLDCQGAVVADVVRVMGAENGADPIDHLG
jgi:hypothetical protein